MPDDNVELVRRIHAAYKRGELEGAIDTYFHPEIEWETRWPGLEQTFHGRDGFRKWMAQVTEPMEIEMDLIEARSVGRDRVFASYRLHGAGRASGIPTEMTVYEIDTFKEGQLLRRQVFYSEDEALDAAGVKGD
jgi:ketosteroid isomerase-like protein